MKRMSAKKAAMQPAYREKLAAARRAQVAERGFQYCEFPDCGRECLPDPHHVGGRIGEHILEFRLVCRTHHRWIHDNGKMARKMGWLK
jgi:hypothetical protein